MTFPRLARRVSRPAKQTADQAAATRAPATWAPISSSPEGLDACTVRSGAVYGRLHRRHASLPLACEPTAPVTAVARARERARGPYGVGVQ